MAGKRARGLSKAADNSTDGKKIKTEQPDAQEESVFEAARRRREARDAQLKKSAPAASSSSSSSGIKAEPGTSDHGADSYRAWEERWEDIYPHKVIRAVGDVRKRAQRPDRSSSLSLPPSVYVVLHHIHGKYVDPQLDVLGTYATAVSANEHAMAYFDEEYRHFFNIGSDQWVRGRESFTDFGNQWDVSSDGCFVLTGNDEDGTYEVFVSKQVVKDEPPKPKPREGTIGMDTLPAL